MFVIVVSIPFSFSYFCFVAVWICTMYLSRSRYVCKCVFSLQFLQHTLFPYATISFTIPADSHIYFSRFSLTFYGNKWEREKEIGKEIDRPNTSQKYSTAATTTTTTKVVAMTIKTFTQVNNSVYDTLWFFSLLFSFRYIWMYTFSLPPLCTYLGLFSLSYSFIFNYFFLGSSSTNKSIHVNFFTHFRKSVYAIWKKSMDVLQVIVYSFSLWTR